MISPTRLSCITVDDRRRASVLNRPAYRGLSRPRHARGGRMVALGSGSGRMRFFYDPWGRPLLESESPLVPAYVALNPFRHRGFSLAEGGLGETLDYYALTAIQGICRSQGRFMWKTF